MLYLAPRWEMRSFADSHPNRTVTSKELFTLPKKPFPALQKCQAITMPNNVTPGMPYKICGLADLIKALLNGRHYSFIKPTENTESLKSTEQPFPHLFILNHFHCCFPRRSHTTMTSEFSVKLTF